MRNSIPCVLNSAVSFIISQQTSLYMQHRALNTKHRCIYVAKIIIIDIVISIIIARSRTINGMKGM